MQSWNGSLKGGQTIYCIEKRRKPFAPAVRMHIFFSRLWALRRRALRIRNQKTGARNYLLSQRTEERRERITPSFFPVGQTPSREEVSRAEQRRVSITPTEEERNSVGYEEKETRGARGEGCTAAPRKPRKKTHLACRGMTHTTTMKLCYPCCMQLHQSKSKQRGNHWYYGNRLPFQRLKLHSSYAFTPSTM